VREQFETGLRAGGDVVSGVAHSAFNSKDNAATVLRGAGFSLASLMFATGAAAQDAGGVALPTIDIFGGNEGYQTTTPSLTRMPTPIINTAQTVNVVPQQVLQDQNISTVRDALRNVAGVTFRAGEGGNQGDTPYIRGFSAQSDIFRDGVRDPGWYTRDAFSIDAVEVYKGPSSFLFGRGSTGGVVNLTSKAPRERTFVDATVSANTGPGARATLDANGKMNENVWARINIVGQDNKVPGRDNVENKTFGIAPSIAMQIDDRTKLTLSYIYQHDNNIPDYGIPFLKATDGIPRTVAPVSPNTWYGILSGPNPDVENVDSSIATAKLEHEFNNQLKVTNTTRYTDVARYQLNVFPEPNANVPNANNLNSNWTPNRNGINIHNTLFVNQTDFLARFITFGWDHTVATGFEFGQEKRDFLRNNWTGQVPTNFLNPDPNRPGGTPLAPTFSQRTIGHADSFAAYIADQIKLNRYFELLGAVRYDYFKFQQDAPLAAANINNLQRTDQPVSWRVGAVYHPIDNTSLYVMRGTSFNPSADNLSISITTPATAISQFNLGPEKNETWEVGAKADVLGGRLSLATALFQTDKTNARVPDPTNSAVTVLNGVIRARGFEASANGKLTDDWQVIATYAFVNARIISTTVAAQLNNEPIQTPAHSLSIWSTYDINRQWQVGGGAFYSSEIYGDLPNTALAPGYWRFDAMAAYKIDPKTTLQFNIYNIFDKYYISSVYSNWAVPGPSRYASLTLKMSW
jgi:catecholate siderophore receptor